MLWLRLWRPFKPALDSDAALPIWGRLLVAGYVFAWLALGIALYVYWWDWSAPVKYSLAFLEALLVPDLAGIRSVFSVSKS